MAVELSIVIVNYKSAMLILNCIASIKLQTSKIAYEIIVADNLSGDDSRDKICKEHPDIIWETDGLQCRFCKG